MTDSEKLDLILNDISDLKSDMQDVKQKVANLELDMQDVKQKVSKIDITLESEIRDNIKRVAEGHFDLSRDLKEAKKSSNEIEMLTVRVNILESDVRKLKEKIS